MSDTDTFHDEMAAARRNHEVGFLPHRMMPSDSEMAEAPRTVADNKSLMSRRERKVADALDDLRNGRAHVRQVLARFGFKSDDDIASLY